MEEITIERKSVGSLSTFRIKSPAVAQELKRRGFVQVDQESGAAVLQATGKWGHRRTRKVVYDTMRKCSQDPLTQAAYLLDQPRKSNVEIVDPWPDSFYPFRPHLKAVGGNQDAIAKCLAARFRRLGVQVEKVENNHSTKLKIKI